MLQMMDGIGAPSSYDDLSQLTDSGWLPAEPDNEATSPYVFSAAMQAENWDPGSFIEYDYEVSSRTAAQQDRDRTHHSQSLSTAKAPLHFSPFTFPRRRSLAG